MTEESRTANKGFCNIGADGITMTFVIIYGFSFGSRISIGFCI